MSLKFFNLDQRFSPMNTGKGSVVSGGGLSAGARVAGSSGSLASWTEFPAGVPNTSSSGGVAYKGVELKINGKILETLKNKNFIDFFYLLLLTLGF